LKPIVTTGNNSPAFRPEFVDTSLSATTSEVDQVIQQEENSEEESDDN
jgi:hypothetical protein